MVKVVLLIPTPYLTSLQGAAPLMTSQARCKQKTWPPAVRRRPHTITITTLYTTLLSLSLFVLYLFFFLVILLSFIISKAIVSSPPPPIFLSPSSSSVHLLLLLPPSSLYPPSPLSSYSKHSYSHISCISFKSQYYH